jgi:hypothetical protein
LRDPDFRARFLRSARELAFWAYPVEASEPTAPGTPDSGYPLGLESMAQQGPIVCEDSSHATVVITGRPAQCNPPSAAFSILDVSQRRCTHEGGAYHERGWTRMLGGR